MFVYMGLNKSGKAFALTLNQWYHSKGNVMGNKVIAIYSSLYFAGKDGHFNVLFQSSNCLLALANINNKNDNEKNRGNK